MDIYIAADSGLHDYEVSDIAIDYVGASILLRLKSPEGVSCTLSINGFTLFSVSHEEKWGAGKYVYSSDLQICDGLKIMELELNSGDTILIKFC